MQKEYQTRNTPDSLWQVSKKMESSVFVLQIICRILLAMVGVVMLCVCQWALIPVFYLGVFLCVILFQGVLKGIRKAKYEEDLEEAYMDEYGCAKEMVDDPRYRCVDETEVVRRIICDREIQTIYLLAALTILAGFFVYFLMNPNPAYQELFQGFYTAWGALV